MNKNNKKTMNERTHNNFDVYKEAQNTNSNTNDRNENRTAELATDLNKPNRKAPKNRD
ncbi:hypothetical protein [Sporosarcina sp. Te-1]|uniref:hypothetical protein n=1 Tax=Sporosarcina sp. Te-1 TaxID=2818390 RepID=UPI001A9D1C78|nr:hypothetical protein [Sporosarcina sp. Te-1]QTD43125.1 hypothetical protein J3U78_10465 [Sporosarcina sp. Te-1]